VLHVMAAIAVRLLPLAQVPRLLASLATIATRRSNIATGVGARAITHRRLQHPHFRCGPWPSPR
jgi:hypothetical protein